MFIFLDIFVIKKKKLHPRSENDSISVSFFFFSWDLFTSVSNLDVSSCTFPNFATDHYCFSFKYRTEA